MAIPVGMPYVLLAVRNQQNPEAPIHVSVSETAVKCACIAQPHASQCANTAMPMVDFVSELRRVRGGASKRKREGRGRG